MKTNRFAGLCGLVLLTAAGAWAQQNLGQNFAGNAAANTSTSLATNIASSVVTNAPAPEGVTEYGQPLLTDAFKDRLRLTPLQRREIKEIEDDFDQSRFDYMVANRPRIEAAYEANRQARVAKDDGRIKASIEQYDLVWSAFRPEREAALAKVKLLLTPEQSKVWDEVVSKLK